MELTERAARRLGCGLIVLAILLRAGAVLVLQSHRVPHSTYEHGEIAANLLVGRGFSVRFLGADGPTSQQAPVYPLLVTGAFALAGVETPQALLILELGQALVGGLLVACVLMLARELAHGRPWVALTAGLLTACHPTLVYAATHVQVALLAATLLTLAFAGGFRTGRTGRMRDAVLTGLALAALILTDPILGLAGAGIAWAVALGQPRGALLLPPPLWESAGVGGSGPQRPHSPSPSLTLPHKGGGDQNARRQPQPNRANTRRPFHPQSPPFLSDRSRVRSLTLTATIAITALLGISPWIVRNAWVHGEIVFIKSTFGYAFWQGNCALSEGTDKVVRSSVERALAKSTGGLRGLNEALWAARHEAGYVDDVALTPADYRMLAALSEPERSRVLFRRALDDLRADPGRYPRLCLRRLRYFVLFDETNPKTRNAIYRASHLGLTLLVAIGLLLAPGDLRRRLAPTLVTAALVTLFHALTIVSARFHIPLEPLMAVWAAAGTARLGSAARADDVEGVLADGNLGEPVGISQDTRVAACEA